MSRIVICIIILVLVLFYKNKIEKYQEILVPTNERTLLSNENVSININLEKLKNNIEIMNKMIECIDSNLQNKNCEVDCENIFGLSDLNFPKMTFILYETYINDFQDLYLINRFNINKYLDITYQLPNDNYNDLIILYNNLKTNVEFIWNNIDNNIFVKIFELTNQDIGKNLAILEDTYNSISSNSTFIASDVNIIINNLINNYLQNILNLDNNLFILKKSTDNNDDKLAYFTIKQIDENNLIDVVESIERMLENEINESQKLINN